MAPRLNTAVAAVFPLSRLKEKCTPLGGRELRNQRTWGPFLALSRLKEKGTSLGGSGLRILGAYGLLMLSGCGLMQPSTEDALDSQRNAISAYESGEDKKAEALYLGLLKASPRDAEAWLRLGNLYARSARPDSAADAYQRGLLLTPNDARLWYNLGVIRQRQTLAAYIQALELTKPGEQIYESSEGQINLLAPSSEKARTADENLPSRKQ